MKPAWILGATLFLCVGCDQATKVAAQQWLSGKPTASYWGDTVRLTYLQNRGAFLSMGADWPEWVRWLLFTVVSLIMVLVALGFVIHRLRGETRLRWLSPVMAGTLLAAGGIGNLIDRCIRDGAVIDFLNVGIGSLRTGVFNVADVQIMAALGIFVFVRDPQHGDPAAGDPAAGDPAAGDPGEDSTRDPANDSVRR
jgi:signal peptidase II